MKKDPEPNKNLEQSADVTPFNVAHGAFQEAVRKIAKDISRELNHASKVRWEAWRSAREVFDRLQEEEQTRYYEALEKAAKSEGAFEEAEKVHAAMLATMRTGARAEFEAQRKADEHYAKMIEQVCAHAIERVQKANRTYVANTRKAWAEMGTDLIDGFDLYKIGESMMQVAADTESSIQACHY